MKNILLIAISVCLVAAASAQVNETQQLLLNVEKLAQLKSILNNMYEGYKVVSKGYNTISSISKGNFNLHDAFLDGLRQVSPVVRKYYKVSEIINMQLRLVQEQKQANGYFRARGSFSPDEMAYLSKTYENLVALSVKNLDELLLVITASQLRMSDDERLEAIDRVHADTQDKLTFLRSFNNANKILSMQRIKERAEIERTEKVYGIK